jgi:hypothetical protein
MTRGSIICQSTDTRVKMGRRKGCVVLASDGGESADLVEGRPVRPAELLEAPHHGDFGAFGKVYGLVRRLQLLSET